MIDKIEKFIYFIGLNKKEYETIKPNISIYNRTMLDLFLHISSILMTILFGLSFLLPTIFKSQLLYLCVFIFTTILIFIIKIIDKKNYNYTQILVYINIVAIMCYSIIVGTVINSNQSAIMFMVMLVFIPILFIDIPIRTILYSYGFTVIFILLDFHYKELDIIITDILNSLLYSTLGIVSGIIVDKMKVNNFLLEHKLQKLGITDILTQTNNRNSFEMDIKTIQEKVRNSLTCIYIDVNGLHELNNEKGHDAGDEMLKYVANQLKDIFFLDQVYRIGGDEFVVFVIDKNEIAIQQKIEELNRKIIKASYHIAIGYSYRTLEEINIDEMLKESEKRMYKDKKQYYIQHKLKERRE